MPTFDLFVLGCGGGPSEHNLSSYLLKPCDAPWRDGIVAIEAGSGLGALQHLLRSNPEVFESGSRENTKPLSAIEVYSWIQCYLITHAHMDHVNSLVLSAGSLGGQARQIFATYETLKDIEGIFSDRLWPNLASWDEGDKYAMLLYSEIQLNGQYKSIAKDLSVLTMPLSHGEDHSHGTYQSVAFFIKHDPSGNEILFFGDVEPDSLASKPQTAEVWRVAAHKFPRTLSTVFIECSWPLGRPDELLYGHLNPEHLSVELSALAREVFKACQDEAESNGSSTKPHIRKKQKRNPPSPEDLRGVLSGLKVYITHCKEDLRGSFDRPINHVIADQVRTLTNKLGLGVDIVAAEQGMLITI